MTRKRLSPTLFTNTNIKDLIEGDARVTAGGNPNGQGDMADGLRKQAFGYIDRVAGDVRMQLARPAPTGIAVGRL